MRHVICFGVVLLATAAVSGCASRLGGSSAPPSSAGSSGVSNVPVLGGVVNAGASVASGVSSAVKSSTAKLTSLVTPKKSTMPADDPTSLAGPGKMTPELHVTMAQMQENSGNIAQARDHYLRALKQDPRYLSALLGLAHLLDRQGKLAEASEKYRLACQYHPRDARAHNDLGLCLARQRKLNDSVQMLSKAVELDPQKKLYRNNLATVLTEIGRMDEALAQLTLVHGPAVAHYNLGCLLYQKGNQPAAAHHFAEAANADPRFVAARQWADRLAAGAAPPTSSPATYGAAPETAGAYGQAPNGRDPRYATPAPVAVSPQPSNAYWQASSAASPGYPVVPSAAEERTAAGPRSLPPVEDGNGPPTRY